MVGKRWIGRDWEGSSHGVIEVLYCNLPYVTEENNEVKKNYPISDLKWASPEYNLFSVSAP
jgi:hypothetical protein